MSSTAAAIELAFSLTTLAGHVIGAAAKLQQAIATARAEGRELTDAELAEYRAQRVLERARWQSQLP